MIAQPVFDLLGVESVDPLAECEATDRGGRRAIFIHVPKAAGTSLKAALGGSRRTTHQTPALLCSAAAWANRVTIVAVRHPTQRFASSYRYHVLSDYRGELLKKVGPKLKEMSPLDYMRLAMANPKAGNFRPQCDFVERRGVPAKLVLRAEESDRWGDQLRILLPDVGDIPHRNQTPSREAGMFGKRSDMTPSQRAKLADMIGEFYEKDFRNLGYDRAEI